MFNKIRMTAVVATVLVAIHFEQTRCGVALAQRPAFPTVGPIGDPQPAPPADYWASHWNWYNNTYRPYWSNYSGPAYVGPRSVWNPAINGPVYPNGIIYDGPNSHGLSYHSGMFPKRQSMFSRPAYGWW